MDLKAEGVKPYFCKALLDNGQSRHLLSHKEHRSAVIQGVCDKVGYGLGFTCSRGSVKDKTLPLGCKIYGCKLGGVGAHWHSHMRGSDLLVKLRGGYLFRHGLPAEFAVYKAGDHFIFTQLIAAAADIVPHNKAVKGKLS